MDLDTTGSIFFDILFLRNGFADGLALTLTLALFVWINGLIIGFLLAEIKFALPKNIRFIINFILWLFKSVPIFILMFYFYYDYYATYDNSQYILFSTPFVASSSAMSFWAIASMADIFYRCRIYRASHQTATSTNINFLIAIPQAIRFLATIITITPIASILVVPEFFSVVHLYLISAYDDISQIMYATILVYLFIIGVITIIAKVLDKILHVQQELF
ncbi:hypothetical protein [Orbus mooreae]|uniref:hypothetical protein n=1 Tax=Orbus mooreae TaxID=3074107 RepID=UPI00370D0493